MGYAWDILIPANTLLSAPVTEKLKLQPGVITRIGCKFARGCHAMVQVRLLRGGVFQLFPLSPGQWLTGDDEEVWFSYYFDLTPYPPELIFEGCSPGTRYEHEVTIRVTILPKTVASMIPVVDLLTRLLQRMGAIR